MASLYLEGHEGYFDWQLRGLSSAFNQSNGYVRAGITVYQFTVGGITDLDHSGDLSVVYAPSSGGTTTTPLTSVTHSPGSLKLYGWTQVKDGRYWPAGQATVVVLEEKPARPDNFYWDSAVASGNEAIIYAWRWNSFAGRINEFRVYKGLPAYNFTTVYSGTTPISASIVNEAWDAINEIPGKGTMPSKAVSGGPMYASFFHSLANAINSIT